MFLRLSCTAALLSVGGGLFAAQPPLLEHWATALAQNYQRKSPALPPPSSLSLTEARVVQAEFVEQLQEPLGPVVGYKAALTNPAAQARFGVGHPLGGVLLEKMLLRSGAKVPVSFGTRSLIEGDLMVRVGSDAINSAQTRSELLAALDAVIPFVELPDLVYANPQGLKASALVAVNVGARLGVMGEPIALAPTLEWEERLALVQLEMIDETGAAIATGQGDALLGHPLEAVRWLRDDLQRQGQRLKPGDLLSLGTLTPLMPAKPGRWTARYSGLTASGTVDVVVELE